MPRTPANDCSHLETCVTQCLISRCSFLPGERSETGTSHHPTAIRDVRGPQPALRRRSKRDKTRSRRNNSKGGGRMKRMTTQTQTNFLQESEAWGGGDVISRQLKNGGLQRRGATAYRSSNSEKSGFPRQWARKRGGDLSRLLIRKVSEAHALHPEPNDPRTRYEMMPLRLACGSRRGSSL